MSGTKCQLTDIYRYRPLYVYYIGIVHLSVRYAEFSSLSLNISKLKSQTRYLAEMTLKGSKGYTHSGGIFGTSTNGIYMIEEDVYVIGLSNCSCNDIGSLTQNLAAAAIGKPYPTLKDVVELTKSQLEQWVGAYEFEDGSVRHIFMNFC